MMNKQESNVENNKDNLVVKSECLEQGITMRIEENNEFQLKVKLLKPNAKISTPAHLFDAGHDVFATQTVTLQPHERYNMPLGMALKFPKHLVCLVMDKSGIAKNTGLHSIGCVIDANYQGEIHAQLVNSSNVPVTIEEGKKICQLVFVPYYFCRNIEYIEDFEEKTSRGEGGFGSTGLQ